MAAAAQGTVPMGITAANHLASIMIELAVRIKAGTTEAGAAAKDAGADENMPISG
jgi:hypothetical protein